MAKAERTEAAASIFEELHSGESGLSAEEAKTRLEKFGPNDLPEPRVRSTAEVFFSQFLSPLIYLLAAAAAVLFAMGSRADSIVIMAILVFNAIIGTIQEGRAENTLRALRTFAGGSATVLRGGKALIIPDAEVVPGDIIILEEGEKVPADARLIAAQSLRTDEAALTGESTAISKIAENFEKAKDGEGARRSRVFKGTHVVGGMGEAVVTETGVRTEIGKISREIISIDSDLPLKRNIAYLSKAIIVAVTAIGALIFFWGAIRGEPLLQMFAVVVSLSVSIIPEGLPIVITLVLAAGVWRMSKQHVLVKKLQAVEALGQAKIIAVDKTGTLTRNEMLVEKLRIDGTTYGVTGAGYEPKGSVLLEGNIIDPLNHPDVLLAGRVASFCVDANVVYLEEEKKWKVSGDPTEAALGVFARKIGFQEFGPETPKIFDLPFDYLRKFHLAIRRFEEKNFLSVVGAPEKVIGLSGCVWRKGAPAKMRKGEWAELENEFIRFSREGYRVLAFAVNPDAEAAADPEHLPELTFVGLFCMRDPLREEAKAAIAAAERAGIRVVMITGDHKITAHAVAKEAGILNTEEEVITGEELTRIPAAELASRFARCNVFARVTPEQKLTIIEVFKKRGEIIAMTGDGVNDAPSLAAADLGVAMGVVGTEVAKEAADLVLLDDDFGHIVSAIEEGRSIYKAIRKVVLYLFSTSIGEVLTIAGAMFLGLPLPLLPVQIVWLNFITDGFLDVSLAMEPKENGLLKDGFKKPAPYILDSFSFVRMAFMGIVIALGTVWIFYAYLPFGIGKALTVALTTLAVSQWFNAWNCKSESRSIFNENPLKNPYLILATATVALLQIFAVHSGVMQRFLHTEPLTLEDWGRILAISATVIIFEEVRKLAAAGIRFGRVNRERRATRARGMVS